MNVCLYVLNIYIETIHWKSWIVTFTIWQKKDTLILMLGRKKESPRLLKLMLKDSFKTMLIVSSQPKQKNDALMPHSSVVCKASQEGLRLPDQQN